MGRTNPNPESVNPATRFFEWSGSEGKMKYWDKEAKENVFVDLPFAFLVLDQLNTITGYSDSDESGFWSNEVRDTRKDLITVRTKSGIRKTALYADLTDVMASGGKFAKSIYIAFYNDEKELVIGNLKASGSFIGQWFDFIKANNVYEIAVEVAGAEAAKKGATNYFTPVLKSRSISKETDDLAGELQKQVQTYLDAYLNKPIEHEEAPVSRNEFEKTKAAAVGHGQTINEPDDFEVPEEDDQIPF